MERKGRQDVQKEVPRLARHLHKESRNNVPASWVGDPTSAVIDPTSTSHHMDLGKLSSIQATIVGVLAGGV